MDSLVSSLVATIMSGGPGSLAAVFALGCYVLLADRSRLLRDLEKMNARLDDITDKLTDTQVRTDQAVTEALNQLRIAIWEKRS